MLPRLSILSRDSLGNIIFKEVEIVMGTFMILILASLIICNKSNLKNTSLRLFLNYQLFLKMRKAPQLSPKVNSHLLFFKCSYFRIS